MEFALAPPFFQVLRFGVVEYVLIHYQNLITLTPAPAPT